MVPCCCFCGFKNSFTTSSKGTLDCYREYFSEKYSMHEYAIEVSPFLSFFLCFRCSVKQASNTHETDEGDEERLSAKERTFQKKIHLAEGDT